MAVELEVQIAPARITAATLEDGPPTIVARDFGERNSTRDAQEIYDWISEWLPWGVLQEMFKLFLEDEMILNRNFEDRLRAARERFEGLAPAEKAAFLTAIMAEEDEGGI